MLRSTCQGFSLLELAVVLGIIGVMAGSGIVVGKATMESAQIATTNTRLNVIETALLSYRRANDRLPCPGDAAQVSTNANYGVEAPNAGVCRGGAYQANYEAVIGASTVVEGSLPVRTLSLPDEFMYDGWGRKFVYSVWAPATGAKGFVNYGISSNCGMQSIRNSVGMARTNNGVYTLVSFGSNGHGAFNERGQRLTAASVNVDELLNCHCNAAGVDTGYLGTYVEKDRTEDITNSLNIFDDMVRYKERWQLQNYYDEYNPGGFLQCPSLGAGGTSYGPTAGDMLGSAEAIGDINGDGVQDLILGLPAYGSGHEGHVIVVFGLTTGLPNPLPLTGFTGTDGFILKTSDVDDFFGASLAVADINNDNIADLIMGAPGANAGDGKVYVMFGHEGPWLDGFNVIDLLGSDGFVIENDVDSGSGFGSSVAGGDLTQDGIADIVVGAPTMNGDEGAVMMMEVELTPWAAVNQLSTLMTSRFVGAALDMAGTSVIVADVNGDGINDLIFGSPTDGTGPGSVTVRYGRRIGWFGGWFKGYWGYNGYQLFGESNGDLFGTSLAAADVDGNYIRDIIIGAPGYSTARGAAYVYFGAAGRKTFHNQVTKFNGINGMRLTGVAAGDRAGTAVAGVDFDSNGYGDVIVGAPGASPGGLAGAGTTYFVFGHQGWASNFNLSTINGTNGFLAVGSTAGDASGSSFAIGDLDSDYIGDVVLGAPLADYSAANAGAVYLLYGMRKPAPWTLSLDLNSL